MSTRAPAPLFLVYGLILFESKYLAGITGDTAHALRGGYHISDEDQTSRSNYSITLSRDRNKAPTNNAAALDVGFTNRAENTLAGERLRAAMAADDPRVACVREIYYWNPARGGTCGYDHPSHGPATTGEDHSGHLHISFYRDSVTSADAVRGVASVINGTGPTNSAGATPVPDTEECELLHLIRGSAKSAHPGAVFLWNGNTLAWVKGSPGDVIFRDAQFNVARANTLATNGRLGCVNYQTGAGVNTLAQVPVVDDLDSFGLIVSVPE